jgi:type III secretion system FlhB-like substrate exporter
MRPDNRYRALGLRYRKDMPAPVVIAKGEGVFARELVRRAEELGILVVRDTIVTESIRFVEVGQEIPESCYEVVAALYRFVFRTADKIQRKGL